MANNYCQMTVLPYLPKAWFQEKDLDALEAQGFSYEANGEELYFYCEDGPCDSDDEEVPSWVDVFQEILIDAQSDIVIVGEGAVTCSKMRSGEFGGFVTVITRHGTRSGGTSQLADMYTEELKAEAGNGFSVGDKVWWTDPAKESSGRYEVTDASHPELLTVTNKHGSEAEVLRDECKKVG